MLSAHKCLPKKRGKRKNGLVDTTLIGIVLEKSFSVVSSLELYNWKYFNLKSNNRSFIDYMQKHLRFFIYLFILNHRLSLLSKANPLNNRIVLL